MSNEDDEYLTASERHAQIMQDGERFFRRLAWSCAGVLMLIVGAILLLVKYHPFWRYP